LDDTTEEGVEEGGGSSNGEVNQRYISTTDPDASLVRQGKGRPKLRYKTHRSIDAANGVITATEVTKGDVNEAHRLTALVDQHQRNTRCGVKVVVADRKYGTRENYLKCYRRGIKAHIPDLKGKGEEGKKRQRGVFPAELFVYDKDTDTYICPNGKRLKRRTEHGKYGSSCYGPSKEVCRGCPIRAQCTTSEAGRTIHRDRWQEELDYMRAEARTASSKMDIKRRQHFMERSFAEGKRYGLKQARWRGLWRVKIQDYMIAVVQNLNILIRKGSRPKKAASIKLGYPMRDVALTAGRISQMLLGKFLSFVVFLYTQPLPRICSVKE